MKELVKLLLDDSGGRDVQLAYDLREAFTRAWVELLRGLCVDLDDAISIVVGSKCNFIPQESAVRAFVERRRGSNNPGFGYPLRTGTAQFFVEFSDAITYGVACRKPDSEDEYSRLTQCLQKGDQTGWKSSEWWACYRQRNVNLRQPSAEEVKCVSDPGSREELVKDVADGFREIADLV